MDVKIKDFGSEMDDKDKELRKMREKTRDAVTHSK
jgi:hypothetical protein